MATWNELLQEARRRNPNVPDFDGVRREQLRRLADHTQRNLIIYVVDFLDGSRQKAQGSALAIDWSDKLGFLEVTRNLSGSKLDVLIESPGGMLEATEAIVKLLRQQFSDIRFIIPNVAKSAATMMAMAGDQLVLDHASELGPIDPQMLVYRDGMQIPSPANAILDQFDWATEEIKDDPTTLPVWIPILNQYGPSLLIECHAAKDLSQKLVAQWLEMYMFRRHKAKKKKAQAVARALASYRTHLSHGRPIDMPSLKGLGLNILDLNSNSTLKGLVWDVYNAIVATFIGTGAYKLFENHHGDCLARSSAPPMPLMLMQGPPPTPPAAQP